MNFILFHLGGTKIGKGELRKVLGFEDEYSTYVVNIKSPSSP